MLVLQTTFGLAISADTGRSWRWVCEDAFSMPSGWDPPLAIGADGAIVVALLDGIVTAREPCAWSRPAGDPRLPVADLASDATGRYVAAAVGVVGDPNGLALSSDGGHTWRAGARVAGLIIDTVEIAPSLPSRVYVSGHFGMDPVLFRSDDGGLSLRETTRDLAGGNDAYIAAVHPSNPDVVYVRSNLGAETFLLRSDDGGARLRRVGGTAHPMLGFALSDDGETVWIGSEDRAEGILRAVRGGPFTRVRADVTVRCMRQHAGVLYVCASDVADGFAVGCSTDGGDHFDPVMSLRDIAGPVACPPGSPVRDRCAPLWPAQQRLLLALDAGATDGRTFHGDVGDAPLDAPPDAPFDAPLDAPLDALVPVDAALDATLDARPDARPDAGFDAPAPPPPPRGRDCGCRAAGHGARGGWAVALALALAARRKRGVALRGRGR